MCGSKNNTGLNKEMTLIKKQTSFGSILLSDSNKQSVLRFSSKSKIRMTTNIEESKNDDMQP